MLTFEIQRQQKYSRGQLLLRFFFGFIYIWIPHGILLCFFALALFFMRIGAFFVILFTGKTPFWYYEWTIKFYRWNLRVSARMYNLVDGYPEFGMEGRDDKTEFTIDHWQINRGELLIRVFFGWLYVGIPHLFCLYFRMIASFFLFIIAFFAVLFTGEYPPDMHRFNTGTFRWAARLYMWYGWLYRDYPPFSGKEDERVGFEFEEKGD